MNLKYNLKPKIVAFNINGFVFNHNMYTYIYTKSKVTV